MTSNPAELEQYIKLTQDFPRPGILFRDISPLLKEKFTEVIDAMAGLFSEAEWAQVDALVGIESRGFLLASALAYAKGKNLLVIRKLGKLPPPVQTVAYALEYGEDSLQMSSDFRSLRVLVVDDVLATGGTLRGACRLCEQNDHQIMGITTLINLKALNDFSWDDISIRSLLTH